MALNLLPLNLVEGVLAKTRAILFVSLFYLFVNSTLHADTCTVIEITCFRALEPNIFSICCLLGHCSNLTEHDALVGIGFSNPHNTIVLLDDFCYDTGPYSTTAFANRESETVFHSNWLVFKVNFHFYVVARHAHFCTAK
jgi:hypothetical protein